MEKSEIRIKFVGRRAALDVCLEMLVVMVDLNSARKEDPYLPLIGGLHLLTGSDCSGLAEQIDFVVREYWSLCLFFQVSRSEIIYLLACPTSHTYVHFPMSAYKKPTELLCLEQLFIPAYSISSYMGTLSMADMTGGAFIVYGTTLTSFLRSESWKSGSICVRTELCCFWAASTQFEGKISGTGYRRNQPNRLEWWNREK